MTDPKPKKPAVPTRTPQKKTRAGIFDNLRQLPHPVEEFLQLDPSQPDPSQPVPTHPDPSHPNPAQMRPVAPERDFNRRANSIERVALPAGMFPGTSKKLYDALYLRTRGAVVPARTVQATKRELMRWSAIKSKNTIAINLKILTAMGLLVSHQEIGDHDGSVYEVLLPEETTQPNPTHPDPSQPDPTRKLGPDPTRKLGWDGSGNLADSKEVPGGDKTSFKTNTERSDDDELRALREAERELTGKNAPPGAWRELVELLTTELRIVAGRTTVSSAPAILTEHLRRRLWKKDKRQVEVEAYDTPPGAAPSKEQIAGCPDCFGTGMWYPEGYEKGVARCGHNKLTKDTGGEGLVD